jgi:hypothetical protein
VLVLAYVLLAVAVYVGNGTRPGLPYALTALAILVVAHVRAPRVTTRALPWALAAGCATAIDPVPPEGSAILSVLVVAQAALGLFALARPRLTGRAMLGVALGIYAVAGAVVIRHYPPPRIDAFEIQQEAASALETGRNPYEVSYPNHYSQAETRAFYGDDRTVIRGYPYPPLTLLVTTAGHAVGGDVRWVLLASQLGIGWLLFALSRGAGHGGAVALALPTLHFLHPRGLFVLDQAWTDPILACAFLAVLLLIQRQRAIGIALGLFLAAKQYSVLAVPLFLKDGRIRPRAWGAAAAIALAVALPFFAWSPRDFIDGVVLFQLRQPFRPDALSLPAFAAAVTGWRAPGALALVGAFAAGAFTWSGLGAAAGKSEPPSRLPLAIALVYMAFFLFAKQAFCNYYYAVGVIILGAAALLDPAGEGNPSPTG